MRVRVSLVLICCFVFCLPGTTQDKTQPAQTAATDWLALVDAGNYAQSWRQAATLFKGAVSQNEWEEQMRAAHAPLGTLISRKLKSAQYTTQLPGASDGQYVVIQYDSSFANKKSAVETVTPMLDKDNTWRVSGYFIR